MLPARARQNTLFSLLNSHDMRELRREPETRACIEDFAIHGLRPGERRFFLPTRNWQTV